VSENLQKLIGVVVMAVLVVVGVVVTNDDDSDFTRNAMLIPGIAQAGGDNAHVAELEMRLTYVEKLLREIPELGILAEVIARAEAGRAEVDESVQTSNRQISDSLERVSEGEHQALETIRRWIRIYQGPDSEEQINEIWNASLTTLEDMIAGIRVQIEPLRDDMNAWLANANAQREAISPQFGPEFPGLGPMVDILCRTQLASWGTTAQWVSTGWDWRNEFWTCGYEQIQLEELDRPWNYAFCLPGQEFSGGDPGWQGARPELFESIGRVGTNYRTDEGGRVTSTNGVCRGGP
tara:strand:+ start:1995 stop:2873 length:879 start_codon:yes stop_codon:yes gene_type:complete